MPTTNRQRDSPWHPSNLTSINWLRSMSGHSRLTRLALAILQPPLPDCQHSLPRSGLLAWAIRLILLWYTVVFTIPLVALLLLLTNILPIHAEWKSLPRVHRFVRCFAIYSLGNLVWSITSYGSPPAVDRYSIPKLSSFFFSRDWSKSYSRKQLDAYVQIIPPLAETARIGILSRDAIHPPPSSNPIPGFWLRHLTPKPKHDSKVFLYLVGGGYVIGTPLAGAFAYSLVHRTSHAVFAPDYTKALSLETSFPGPLEETLAAWQLLRSHGWQAEQIIVIGDSAGGGLAWSLLVYLAASKKLKGVGDLGVPSSVILISPWLSLPPALDQDTQLYPDILNTPQLQNAARNYLSRFPPYPAHSDPFHAEMPQIEFASSAIHTARRLLLRRSSLPSKSKDNSSKAVPLEPTLEYLLSPSSFVDLSSSHPLYSPASASPSTLAPFLSLIAESETNFFIHTGTAEMFHPSIVRFHHSLLQAGINAKLEYEQGGVHCEALFWPASFGGAPARCLDSITSWLENL